MLKKEHYDLLYHLLRLAAVDGDDEDREAAYGIASHLTSPRGHYPGLLRYLDVYGRKFMLEEISSGIGKRGWELHRVVDLGAGTGWLGKGLTKVLGLGHMPVLVDKRRWALGTWIMDLETPEGLRELDMVLEPTDLVVMCELLHCLDNIPEVLDAIAGHPVVVIEYDLDSPLYSDSYRRQLEKFGARPVMPGAIIGMLRGRSYKMEPIPPYMMFLVDPVEGES